MIIDNIRVVSGKSKFYVFSQQRAHISKFNLCNILFIKGTYSYVHRLIMNHKIDSNTCSDNVYVFTNDKIKYANNKLNNYIVNDDELHVPQTFIHGLGKYGYNNVYKYANEPYSLVFIFSDNDGNFYPGFFEF